MTDIINRTEERVTSATGGEKGKKLAQIGAIDPLALYKLAEVAGFGAQKYAAFNYLKGYDWSLSFDAAGRHLLQFLMGEDNDPESGLPHPLHFAWHGLALASFLLRGIGNDDRFKQPEAEAERTTPPSVAELHARLVDTGYSFVDTERDALVEFAEWLSEQVELDVDTVDHAVDLFLDERAA